MKVLMNFKYTQRNLLWATSLGLVLQPPYCCSISEMLGWKILSVYLHAYLESPALAAGHVASQGLFPVSWTPSAESSVGPRLGWSFTHLWEQLVLGFALEA